MSKLPHGWKGATLADVAIWGSGGTPSRRHPEYFGGNIPWIKTGELQQRVIYDTEEKLTDAGLNNSSAKVFPKGSVAVAMYGATIGKTAILGVDAATNQACAVGVPISGVITPKFLYYYLASQKDAFVAAGKGGAQPNISQGVVKGWHVPLPPLAEQERIADKLDVLLARVDDCRARLDRVPAILKRFRQAVLAAAVSGRLTEEWREERKLEDIGSFVSLEQTGARFSYGSSAKSSQSGGVPVLRMGNIQEGKLDWSDLVFTSDMAEIAKYELRAGDVLFNRTNSPELVGKTAVYGGERPAIYAGYLVRVRCSDQLLPMYLNFCLNSPSGRDYCWKVKSDGVSQSNINARKLAAFEFWLPRVDEQHEIVSRVGVLFGHTDRLEANYEAARDRMEQLTLSLLAKAFQGELVTQELNQ